MARAGGPISERRIAAVRASEARLTRRVNEMIFDDVDVLVTPGTATGPPRVGQYQRRGALYTANVATRRSPFVAIFNATGQPAAVVPWGLDNDGLPVSVQLVGRPFDEATLLALAAQIAAARPWADCLPSILEHRN